MGQRRTVSAMKIQPGPENRSGQAREQAEDRALLERIAGNDPAAFREALDRYLGGVMALARRMLRDDAEAEDVAQEAMLRLWRAGSDVEIGPHGLRPWLRRVASNLCIDRIRSGQRVTVTDEVPEETVEADQLTRLEDADMATRVGGALKALPERQRQALTLFHYEGLSQIEIGAMMGISDEAVESLLARARRSLKASLEKDWQSLLADRA